MNTQPVAETPEALWVIIDKDSEGKAIATKVIFKDGTTQFYVADQNAAIASTECQGIDLAMAHDNILVWLKPRAEQSVGGIHIPEVARDMPVWGFILSAGPKAEGVHAGDCVYVPRNTGALFAIKGHQCVIMKAGKALAKEG